MWLSIPRIASSCEAGTRAVALDVLPAGLIRTLEVSKTLTPDQDASSLGGTVEVKTLSAFDLPGTLLVLGAGATWAVGAFAGWKTSMTASSILLAAGFAAFVGLAAFAGAADFTAFGFAAAFFADGFASRLA